MSKVEKQFKQDFESTVKYNKKFDTSLLEMDASPKARKISPLKIIIPVSCACLTLGLLAGAGYYIYNEFFPHANVVKEKNKAYSNQELEIIESNTFKKLNDIIIPFSTSESGEKKQYSSIEVEAYSSFANTILNNLTEGDNSMFCPATLFSVLSNLSFGASDEVLTEIDSLLGMDKSQKTSFIRKLVESNSFCVEHKGSIKMHNAAFLNSIYSPLDSYIDDLSKTYTDVYGCEFNDGDIEKIVQWAKDATSNESITKKDLGYYESEQVNKTIPFTLLSTMYFNSEWSVVFEKDPFNAPFTLSDNTQVNVEYIEHSYRAEQFYEYDNYYSLYDGYTNNSSIVYIIPKENQTIYDVISSTNVFIDKRENLKLTEETPIVDLTTPTFNLEKRNDYHSIMENLGCDTMFNDECAFDKMNENGSGKLKALLEADFINLSKKGTEIKSVAVGAGAAKSINPETFEVNLTSPFGYIIKDLNGMPLYAGIVDNPQH